MATDERWIPVDPECRGGLYKQLKEVPPHHRLKNYTARFEGRDVWSEYIQANDLIHERLSENHRHRIERTGRRWKSHMDDIGRHQALCLPDDVEGYANRLLEEFELSPTVAARYWGELERFYRWMLEHTEYPHRYNPFVMAAINYDTSRDLWYQIMDR